MRITGAKGSLPAGINLDGEVHVAPGESRRTPVAQRAFRPTGDWREIFRKSSWASGKGVRSSAGRDTESIHSPSQLAIMGVKEATGQFLGPASMSINVAQQVMKDGDAPGRTAAVVILGADTDPFALSLLEWALTDRSWAVHAGAAKALGLRGNHETISKPMPLLSDDRHLVRVMSAATIVKLSIRSESAEISNEVAASVRVQ